ncbi:MAG: hypothetical protein Q7R47_05215 [Candidatus Diapherotrites archaeon]|nr:hypothetical protein [Candidatus Diapherotrites archaeon]
MDTMTLMIAVVLMILSSIYGAPLFVIGIAAIVALSERNISTIALMTITVVAIYGLADVLSQYIPYILLGVLILGMLFGKQQQPAGEGGMAGLEGLYGPPQGYG